MNETIAYSTGMVVGIKQTLLKIQKRIREKPGVLHSALYAELTTLMNEVNQFPTVEESGSFIIDPKTELITFKPKS